MSMTCIQCEENDALVPGGYCRSCLTVSRSETERGWLQLREYLERWAEFAEWCAARGVSPT